MQNPAVRVTSIADSYLAAFATRNPDHAAYFGIPTEDHHVLPDNSVEGLRTWQQKEDAWIAELRAVESVITSGSHTWVLHQFLLHRLQSSINERILKRHLWGMDQVFGWPVSLPLLAERQPVGTPDERRQALARWQSFPGFIASEIARLREGVGVRFTAPKCVVQRTIDQLTATLAPGPVASRYASPGRRAPDAAFGARWDRLVREQIFPEISRFRSFLQDEYLKVTRESLSISDLPSGREGYEAVLYAATGLDVSPETAHEMGLEQLRRTEERIRAVAEPLLGSIQTRALHKRLRSDTGLLFQSPDEALSNARSAVERAMASASMYFRRLPRARVVVEPFPSSAAEAAPAAQYVLPSADGAEPGRYWINLERPQAISRVLAETITFHETLPGHHLQLAFAQENDEAHPVTRYLGNVAFLEGWATYAEMLAGEIGLFSSPLSRLGQFLSETTIAAALVVDTGIHALGWSREKASAFVLEHMSTPENRVGGYLSRLAATPAQATTYLLGRLQIQELRAEAERNLGASFDLRDFHDLVLQHGSVTLPILRQQVRTWTGAGSGSPAA